MRSAIKNVCIKTVSIFVVLFGFIFSLSAFGTVGSIVQCDGDDLKDYNEIREYLKKNPKDVMMIYSLGVNALCIGRMEEAIDHIENASSGGHIAASHIMALYHKTDGTFDNSQLTMDPQNFSDMIHYYEEAAKQIEAASNYPEGVTEDMPYLEEHSRTSAKVFVSLPDSYYNGYGMALGAVLEGKANYVDTTEVLRRMRDAADRCLARPSLSVWNGNKKAITNAVRVRCQAMFDFADDALGLEQTRISVARQCSVPPSECSEHKGVISDLAVLSGVMWEKLDAAPIIH